MYCVPLVRPPNVPLACQLVPPLLEYSTLTLLQPELFVVLAVAMRCWLPEETLLITGASGLPTATTAGDGALGSEKLRFLSVLKATTVKLAVWFRDWLNVACVVEALDRLAVVVLHPTDPVLGERSATVAGWRIPTHRDARCAAVAGVGGDARCVGGSGIARRTFGHGRPSPTMRPSRCRSRRCCGPASRTSSRCRSTAERPAPPSPIVSCGGAAGDIEHLATDSDLIADDRREVASRWRRLPADRQLSDRRSW